jgi:A/G-specific adenine glycosylase
MTGRRALLEWYRPRARAYPWRSSRDPYPVLVSEVMLQQTQAVRVVPAFRKFLRRFPSVEVLAQASRAQVLRAWSGLGYNRRAVALSEAARAIVRDHHGRVPSDPEALVGLPGVGSYTAAAVASVAFGDDVAAIDTNVARVVARARLGTDAAAAEPIAIRRAAHAWLDRKDPGSWNQALMDLGRLVCRPRPRCGDCPLEHGCRFRRSGARLLPASHGKPAFEGSTRQLRGMVVRALMGHSSITLRRLSRLSGRPLPELAVAVRGLHGDGILRAGPTALAGNPRGRVSI